MLNKQFYALRMQIEKLSIRERVLTITAFSALLLLAAQGIVMLAGYDQTETVQVRIEQHRNTVKQNEMILSELESSLNNPNILALQNSNRELADRIETIEERISLIDDTLMAPGRMIELLRELLEKQSQLTLLSFNALPVEVIESNVSGSQLFYEHGLEIELEGSFEALSRYLADIESLDAQLFWDKLYLETENFPKLRIQIEVHTLSRSEEWLHV